MSKLISEDKLVQNRVDDYLEKSSSKFSKFLESTPNFVTYYQYDRVNSTLDKGLDNVEKHIGAHSPNRFNKIEKFPLYGMDLMSISQDFSEIGMDTTYESEAVILPGTIKPLQNDFFIIPVLKDDYLFRIIDIQYDSIMNDNYYRISFRLEYIDELKINEIVSVLGYLYRCIGVVILAAGMILSIFLPLIFPNTEFEWTLIYFAYYSFLASSFLTLFNSLLLISGIVNSIFDATELFKLSS